MAKKQKAYIDSCCFIELAAHRVGGGQLDRARDVLYTTSLLESAFDEEVEIYTASLSIAECQCVRDKDKNRLLNDSVKSDFKSLLTSGQYVILVQDTILVAEQARDLIWVHRMAFGGADAIHVAAALSVGCEEFLTFDKPIQENADALLELFGLRVIAPRKTRLVSDSKHPEGGVLFAAFYDAAENDRDAGLNRVEDAGAIWMVATEVMAVAIKECQAVAEQEFWSRTASVGVLGLNT